MKEYKDLFEECKEGKKIFSELVEEFKREIEVNEITIKAFREKDTSRKDPEADERVAKRLEEEVEILKKRIVRIENYLKGGPPFGKSVRNAE